MDTSDPATVRQVVAETRQNYVRNMIRLLEGIHALAAAKLADACRSILPLRALSSTGAIGQQERRKSPGRSP